LECVGNVNALQGYIEFMDSQQLIVIKGEILGSGNRFLRWIQHKATYLPLVVFPIMDGECEEFVGGHGTVMYEKNSRL
jgi:hypothetical protein